MAKNEHDHRSPAPPDLPFLGGARLSMLRHSSETLRGVFAMGGLRESRKRVREVLTAALLVEGSEGLSVRFLPAVTGHEEYRFDSAFVERILNMPTRTEQTSIFGGKEYARFSLCMGGGGYDAWTVLVEDMHAMVRAFRPALPASKE